MLIISKLHFHIKCLSQMDHQSLIISFNVARYMGGSSECFR